MTSPMATMASRAKRDAKRERLLAVAEERARIARDLNDSAGSEVNVIAVRAGAARLRHAGEPHRSVEALEAIEELARRTVEEIDHIVGALRESCPRTGEVDPARTRLVGRAGGTAGRCRSLAPEVVLMDVRMPDLDGIEATRRLAGEAPGSRVLILTTFEQDDYVFDALRAGASGFLLNRTRPEELIAAVHTIAVGDSLLSPHARVDHHHPLDRDIVLAHLEGVRPDERDA